MKILYITFKNIASLNAGDKIVSYSFLRQVSEVYRDITLVNILDEGGYSDIEKQRLAQLNVSSFFYEDCEVLSLGAVMNSLLYRDPIVFTRKCYRNKLKRQISELCAKLNPELIIWDHFRSLAYFSDGLFKFKNLLIEHNNESKVMLQRSKKSSFPINIISYWQSKLIYSRANFFHAYFNGIIFISSYDFDSINQLAGNCFLIRRLNLYFHHAAYHVREKVKHNLIFIGSLDWFPNVEAVLWFIREVLPLIHSDVELNIVGRNPLKEIVNLIKGNVKVHSNVLSIEDYIQDSDIFLAPLLSGSGINIKILEALSYGIPVVGTSHAFRGYDGLISGEFKPYDYPADFANQIDTLCSSYKYRKEISEYELAYYNQYSRLSKDELIQAIDNFTQIQA